MQEITLVILNVKIIFYYQTQYSTIKQVKAFKNYDTELKCNIISFNTLKMCTHTPLELCVNYTNAIITNIQLKFRRILYILY